MDEVRERGGLVRFTGACRTYSWLAVPAVVAFLLRVYIVVSFHPECDGDQLATNAVSCFRLRGDAAYMRIQGHYLAKGHGFVNSGALVIGADRPGAYHPPGLPTLLAGFNIVGVRSMMEQRIALGVVGVVGVVLIGVLTWRLAGRHGRTAGMIAATIAAVHPLLWLNDTQAMSESIFVPIGVAAMATTYWLWRQPKLRIAVLLGVTIGLAWLTRSEAVALFAVMVLPVLWGLHNLSRGVRAGLLAVAFGISVLMVAPWVAYNLSRFSQPTLLTTSTGDALIYRSCDGAFYGETVGYYSLTCDPKPHLNAVDESAQDQRSRTLAIEYLSSHVDRIPAVLAFRFGRLWEVYRPEQNANLSAYLDERGYAEAKAGLAGYYLLLLPAVYGAICLRRRGIPISPLVGQFLLVTATALATSPVVRYRILADVAAVILAGIGIADLLPRVRDRLRRARRPVTTTIAAGAMLFVPLSTTPTPLPVHLAGSPPVSQDAYGQRLLPTTPLVTVPYEAPKKYRPGVEPPHGCEYTDAMVRLYDAYDADTARHYADKLKQWAPRSTREEIDLIVVSDGDLLTIDEPFRIKIMREIALSDRDKCSAVGTPSG